ncbi:small fragment nuclease isoform X1 [Phycodurus eques]|uniref:small fragment nuclease isoform X1 n=1 Tax=Phycodurus eques TaxID=693459 RepID=UPI002ACEA656|nr:small fragment nuclease isoform X1 [Phycodurus eques]
MNATLSQKMVWVDLEMTGLDIENDKIIEMTCIITDSDLNILAEGPNLIINQSDELLESMSEWCTEHHGKSGLTQAVGLSKTTLEQAECEFTSFVRQHTPPGQCPLAGNSVHADKRFLDKYMPEFMKHLHYRIIDVSTIKELCRRWFPVEYEMVPQKKATHSTCLQSALSPPVYKPACSRKSSPKYCSYFQCVFPPRVPDPRNSCRQACHLSTPPPNKPPRTTAIAFHQ